MTDLCLYRFTAQARRSTRYRFYTRHRWDNAQGDRYLTSLEWRCLQLAQEQRLPRPYDDNPSYWRALAGKHVIFCRGEADRFPAGQHLQVGRPPGGRNPRPVGFLNAEVASFDLRWGAAFKYGKYLEKRRHQPAEICQNQAA